MADSLRRGFKAEAERRALAIRRELGLGPTELLDAQLLAAHLQIPVMSVTELRDYVKKPASISRIVSGSSGFSAATVCAGSRRLIVFNPSHPPGRRANSLMHELSHVLLRHRPQPALGIGGCRHWDAEQEAEADWQAAALLVPRDGALWWMRHNGDTRLGAQHFGVSEALFRWRVNQTGVARQLKATHRLKPTFADSVKVGMSQVSQRYARQPLLAQRPKLAPARTPAPDSPAATSSSRTASRKHKFPQS